MKLDQLGPAPPVAIPEVRLYHRSNLGRPTRGLRLGFSGGTSALLVSVVPWSLGVRRRPTSAQPLAGGWCVGPSATSLERGSRRCRASVHHWRPRAWVVERRRRPPIERRSEIERRRSSRVVVRRRRRVTRRRRKMARVEGRSPVEARRWRLAMGRGNGLPHVPKRRGDPSVPRHGQVHRAIHRRRHQHLRRRVAAAVFRPQGDHLAAELFLDDGDLRCLGAVIRLRRRPLQEAEVAQLQQPR